MKTSLSAIVIAKNEERDLPACLESLRGLVDELVVLIDESCIDHTEEIARSHGAKILRRRFDDYASQKQAALDAATGIWVLSIDADERVTPALHTEISALMSSPPTAVNGFLIPFTIYFLGQRMRYGGLGGESHLRLFRRTHAHFTGGALHEGITLDGLTGRLRGALHHEPYKDISDYLGKLDLYTTLAAHKRFAAGRRFHLWHHLILPWEFFCRAVLKLGLLDGRPGIIWAGLSAFHSWIKYVKLAQLEDAP